MCTKHAKRMGRSMNEEWLDEWLDLTPHVDSKGYVVEYLTHECDAGEYKVDLYRTEKQALDRADLLSLSLKRIRVNYPDGFSTRVY